MAKTHKTNFASLIVNKPGPYTLEVRLKNFPLVSTSTFVNNGDDPFILHNRNKRYIGPQAFTYDRHPTTGGVVEEHITMLQITTAKGANIWMPTLHWDMVETSKDVWDWRMVDDIFAKAALFNVKVLLRFVISRSIDKRSNVIDDSERAVDIQNNYPRFANQLLTSYDNDTIVAKQKNFVQKTLERIKSRSNDAALLFGVSVVDNPFYEGEYIGQNSVPDGSSTYYTLYDFSEASRLGFIRRMKVKYNSNLTVANQKWSTNFSNWDSVQLPKPTQVSGEYWDYKTTYTQDFQLNRSFALSDWLKQFALITKSISSNLLVFMENGSLQDPASVNTRASFLLPAITDFVDARKQNGTPYYPHKFSAQISRIGGKLAMEEFFTYKDASTSHIYTVEEMVSHASQAFDAGCFVVVSAGMIPNANQSPGWNDYLQRIESVYGQLQSILSLPITPQTNATPYIITAKQILDNSHMWQEVNGSSIKGEYEKVANNTLLPINLINDL